MGYIELKASLDYRVRFWVIILTKCIFFPYFFLNIRWRARYSKYSLHLNSLYLKTLWGHFPYKEAFHIWPKNTIKNYKLLNVYSKFQSSVLKNVGCFNLCLICSRKLYAPVTYINVLALGMRTVRKPSDFKMNQWLPVCLLWMSKYFPHKSNRSLFASQSLSVCAARGSTEYDWNWKTRHRRLSSDLLILLCGL